MYYRLMIPELVEATKVLYLDCDILVRKDISPLFEIDLDDKLCAAVVNPFHDAGRLGLSSEEVYFNSGVLLINTKEWKNHNVKQQVLDYMRENSHLLQMPDQDALNVVMRHNWVEIDPTYNCQVSMLIRHRGLAEELSPHWTTAYLEDPAIMHFSAGHKQWHQSNRIRYSREYRTLRTHIMEARRGPVLDFIIGLLRQAKLSILQSNPYFY